MSVGRFWSIVVDYGPVVVWWEELETTCCSRPASALVSSHDRGAIQYG